MRYDKQPSVIDFLGFLAYLFAVTGGQPDRNSMRRAAALLFDEPDEISTPEFSVEAALVAASPEYAESEVGAPVPA